MYGIQYLFDGGLRKFMFRQVEVVRLTRRVRKILTTHSLESAGIRSLKAIIQQRTVVINIHVG
jgi:hypothetical protein